MKKVYILAALLMATTSAHAGNGVSVEIEGKRINIEVPSDCNSVSCLKIGFSGSDAKRVDDADNARPSPRRANVDDDRASGPGRPDFKGGRRFNNEDDFAGRPGRPGVKGGRRGDDDDFAGRPGRPDFKGGRRGDDDDFAGRPGRPDVKGGRRFNGEDDFAGRSGRPDSRGGRRFNEDDAYASEAAGRSGFKGGNKSRRDNDNDDTAARPDRAPTPVSNPAAPAPTAANANTVTPPAPAPAPTPATAPTQVAAATRAPAPATAADSDPNSPLGVWATEDKGNVRIEQCGETLCGFAEKTGEKILINMKAEGAKWTGVMNDPDSGRKSDSLIAMRGVKSLRVQSCASNSTTCSGQTWKRVS